MGSNSRMKMGHFRNWIPPGAKCSLKRGHSKLCGGCQVPNLSQEVNFVMCLVMGFLFIYMESSLLSSLYSLFPQLKHSFPSQGDFANFKE